MESGDKYITEGNGTSPVFEIKCDDKNNLDFGLWLALLFSCCCGHGFQTHAAGSAIAPPTVFCSFVFRVVDFITDDFF